MVSGIDRKPSWSYSLIYRLLVVPLCWRNTVHFDKSAIRTLKPPFVVVSNHPSFYDWAYVAKAIWPHRVTFLVARYYFYNRFLGPFLRANGAIPKSMFAADYQAAKRSLAVVRQGGVFGIFPEGRRAVYGELETVSSSAFSLIQRMGVPVVNVHIEGGYLATPKYSNTVRHGRVSVKASLLFSVEDLAALDVASGHQKLFDALYYNDFDRANKFAFRSAIRAENLESILYLCPQCGQEFTLKTKGNEITCKVCGAAARLDACYEFQTLTPGKHWPLNIREWYLLQKKTEASRVTGPEFSMQGFVTLKQPQGGQETFTIVGHGIVTISHEGLRYEGTRLDQPFSLHIPLNSLKAIAFDVNESFEAYLGQEYFNFVPENPLTAVKWSVVYEQLYLKGCQAAD